MQLLKSPNAPEEHLVSNRLLRRSRDFAQVEGNGAITLDIAKMALNRWVLTKVDWMKWIGESSIPLPTNLTVVLLGLIIYRRYWEEKDTIEDVFEPYLIMKGFIQRTRQGRILTQRGKAHIGIKTSSGPF